MHIHDSIDPLECIFMALLALFNEGIRDHCPICENFHGNFWRDFSLMGYLTIFLYVVQGYISMHWLLMWYMLLELESCH